ncbi:MAG: hypothetical protein GX556_04020 [Fibrobacter sp.]|nr:hypothetical protein [Fibrobacter sp.]
MKKTVSFICMMLTMCLAVSGFASTKYDVIIVNPGWKQIINAVDESVTPNKIVTDYLNLLVNKNDLHRIIKSGALDKEKTKFIAENNVQFLKYLYYLIAVHQYPKIKPEPTDAQLIYITGVIKNPRAQAAKNATEYEMEKTFFRGSGIYSLWESWRADGFIERVINEQIDILYANEKKQKNKK